VVYGDVADPETITPTVTVTPEFMPATETQDYFVTPTPDYLAATSTPEFITETPTQEYLAETPTPEFITATETQNYTATPTPDYLAAPPTLSIETLPLPIPDSVDISVVTEDSATSEYTLTPAFSERNQDCYTLQPPTIITLTYAYIALNDMHGFLCAVDYSNARPTQLYPIYLDSGTYQIPETIAIFGQLQFLGRGIDKTILLQTGTPGNSGTMNGMFTLVGSYLRFDHLTVKQGRSTGSNFGKDGAVWVQGFQSVLHITNSKFDNNESSSVGGAVFLASGRVEIVNSIFFQNKSRDGGAIYANSSIILTPAIIATSVDFRQNSAINQGGAVYNLLAQAKLIINNSNFRGNQSTAVNAVRKNIFIATPPSVLTPTAGADARWNYWTNPTIVPAANTGGVNSLNPLSALVPMVTVAPQPLPILPTATPTPMPTATIWYVTCHNLTGSLNVKDSPNGNNIGQVNRGTQVIRLNLTEHVIGQYVRVEIFWPLGQSSNTAFVSIRDAIAADGDYLTPIRDVTCPRPSATPTVSFTPTPTATFDPSIPNFSAGRFEENRVSILSIFGPYVPANMGALGFHGGVTQFDVVPKHLEECLDTHLVFEELNQCDNGGLIAIYAPVDGCIWRTEPSVIVFIIKCEGDTAYPDGRREFELSHLEPNSISTIPHTTQPGPKNFVRGEFIGYLCPNTTKTSCNIGNDVGTHLAFSLRFYKYPTFVSATNDEFLGFLAKPSCLFDDWANQSPPIQKPSSPYEACPTP